MTTYKKPAPLRDQIIAFLTKRTEANLKQIVAATTERDFPSRVTNELNKLRADAVVECAKKKGKNELWYWLSQPATNADASVPQPAVGDNTGSRVAESMPPAADATVQPQPAPAATVPPTAAPAAEDESMSDGTRVLLNNLETQIAKVRSVIRDGARIRLCDVGDTVLARISHLEDSLGDMRKRAELAENRSESYLAARAELRRELDEVRATLAPLTGGTLAVSDLSEADVAKKAAAVIEELRDAHREQLNMIAIASETLAPLASGDIDTSDMDLHELAEQAAARIAAKDTELLEQARVVVALRDTITQRNAELSNAQALVEKLEHLLQSARNEAEHLRRHANHSGDAADMVNHPPHYQGKVECIDAIEAALGPEGFVAYCRGNALKYSFRAGRKGDAAQDIHKALWYAARALQTINPPASLSVPA